MSLLGKNKKEDGEPDYFQPWETNKGTNEKSSFDNNIEARTPDPILARESRPLPDFGSKHEPCPPDRCDSLVSAGSTWEGTLMIDSSVRIDGTLSGEIEAGSTVHISEKAKVEGKVRAAFVVIAGAFEGQVHCAERLELLPASRVKGEFAAKSLMVQEGAFVDGQIHMIKSDDAVGGSFASFGGSSKISGAVPSGNGSANAKRKTGTAEESNKPASVDVKSTPSDV